jgi:hypothetical protein
MKLECLLAMDSEKSWDGFEAIENGKADAILPIEWNVSLSNRFGVVEPLFMNAEQDQLYYLVISNKCDARIAKSFIETLSRIMDHEDAAQIYKRYAMRPPVLFSCTLPSREVPAVLSNDDVARLQVQSARVFYSSEEFSQMSCAYEQRFTPFGAGILKDSALRILWQNWLHPCLKAWHAIPGLLQDLNQQSFGGCNGWRLPTTDELYSINRYSAVSNTLLPFWSADKEQLSNRIWTVDLGNGKISPAGHDEIQAFIAVCPGDKGR